ncbi:MAG TPA: hypothetical protein VKB19_11290 [Pedobacter sp.]|nr:hypothetical protein [Pedobacter sp.]
MKRILITLLFSLCCSIAFSQSLEATIVYKNTYKSKYPNLTDAQLTELLGTVQNYYIKGENYKSVSDGKMMQWQLYRGPENKIYNKMSNSDKAMVLDASINEDQVISVKVEKNAATILGYKCDKLILQCKSGVQNYFFAPNLFIDKKLYSKHAYGNYYAFLSASNSAPLKMTIDAPTFYMEGIATSVSLGKVSDDIFKLPAEGK